jgi:hypothetical protein
MSLVLCKVEPSNTTNSSYNMKQGTQSNGEPQSAVPGSEPPSKGGNQLPQLTTMV